MAWTLFLARAGARTAKRTAAEMVDGDGVLDRLFQIAVIVTIWVVGPILVLVAGARWLLERIVGHPVATLTVVQVLLATFVVGAVAVVVARGHHASRRAARAARAARRPAPAAVAPPVPAARVANRPRPAVPVSPGPLTGPQLGALRQIRSAGDPLAVDTVARYQSSDAVRALVAHGLLDVDPATGRFVLR